MISKWTVLVLACMVTFGMYYSFDSPSVLHEQLYKHFKKKNESYTEFEFDFSLIYSVYSLPNTFLPLIGGLLVDRFGNNRIMIIFGLFVLVGNFIQTFACVTKSMSVYIFGRFIFGVGAETLGVCGNTIVSRWFRGSELAFALAINLSFCKLAGVMNDWISPVVEEWYGVDVTSYSISLVCLVCYILTIILVVSLPKDEETISDDTTSEHIELGTTSYYQTATSDDPNSTEVSHNDVQEYQEYLRETSKNKENEVIRHTVMTKTKTPTGEYINEESVIEYHRRTSETSVLSAEKPGCMKEFCTSMCQLNINVWILFFFTFLMYGVFLPFNNISNPILLEFFFKNDTSPAAIQKDLVYAAQLQSIPYFLSVFVNPVLGISIDWLGYRTALFTFSATTLIIGHGCIYFHVGPILPLMLLGMAYSTFATVLWACVPVVVKDELTGTAYGLMASFQNTAQFVMPLILQYLFAKDHGSYTTCELWFMGNAAAGLVLAIIMWILDERMFNGILRLPTLTSDGAASGGSGSTASGSGGSKGEYTAINGSDPQAHLLPHNGHSSSALNGGADNEHKFQYTNGGSTNGSFGNNVSEWGPLSRTNSMQEPRPYRIRDTLLVASHFPFSSTSYSTPSPSFASDKSSSPEPVISKVPIRVVPIPTIVPPGSFSMRNPFTASLQGQFPQSDPSEFLKQVAEKNRLIAPPVPFSMMAPGSFKVMSANGGANKVAIPYYFSDPRRDSPVALPQEQQYLVPKTLTKARSFHYGSRI